MKRYVLRFKILYRICLNCSKIDIHSYVVRMYFHRALLYVMDFPALSNINL